MKVYPEIKELQQHIDHYWIVQGVESVFAQDRRFYAYPGIRPEIIIILGGTLRYFYNGQHRQTNQSFIASHIDSFFIVDTEEVSGFIIVQFKPRSVASLMPFMRSSLKASQLLKSELTLIQHVYPDAEQVLINPLKNASIKEMREILDSWFYRILNPNYTGFITEVFGDLDVREGLSGVRSKTRYSVSTLERYVKRETGLTPKKYLSLKRCKSAIEEICDSIDHDWMDYVEKYGYHDQSHFIKEVKRYTSFTPTQLSRLPHLRKVRPKYS